MFLGFINNGRTKIVTGRKYTYVLICIEQFDLYKGNPSICGICLVVLLYKAMVSGICHGIARYVVVCWVLCGICYLHLADNWRADIRTDIT